MTLPAVVDTSVAFALVRGDVFVHLPQIFQPIYIGSGAVAECQRKDPTVYAVVQQVSSGQAAWLTAVALIARSRTYAPQLSREDIEGIEIALDKSAVLLTQDDFQEVEAKSAGVQVVLNTIDLLFGFKQRGLIPLVRPVLEQMELNGESYTLFEKNRLLRRVREPLMP
jgi:predicted nucleic acid-binding protein